MESLTNFIESCVSFHKQQVQQIFSDLLEDSPKLVFRPVPPKSKLADAEFCVSTSFFLTLINKANTQIKSLEDLKQTDLISLGGFVGAFTMYLDSELQFCENLDWVLYFQHNNGFVNVVLANNLVFDRFIDFTKTSKHTTETATPQCKCDTLGHVESVFVEKFGTPRQSCMVQGAKGNLTLTDPQLIEDYRVCVGAHLLILFVFHLDVRDYNNLKGKILPPKLQGHKMGIFATRTPHRFNPIGLSICRVEHIEDNRVVISGVDLVNLTPVVGLSVYSHDHRVDKSVLKIPEWLEDTKTSQVKVKFDQHAADHLQNYVTRISQNCTQNHFEQYRETIQNILELNPHTVSTNKKLNLEIVYAIQLDLGTIDQDTTQVSSRSDGSKPADIEETKRSTQKGVINLTHQQIKECEELRRHEVKFVMDMATVGRPGISYLFATHHSLSDEYYAERHRVNHLWGYTHKLYQMEHEVGKPPNLTANYQDRYVNLEPISVQDLINHKYPIILAKKYKTSEEGELKNPEYISNNGEGYKYKFMRFNSLIVRGIFDLNKCTKVDDFDCNIIHSHRIPPLDLFKNLSDFQYINRFPFSNLISGKSRAYENYIKMKVKFSDEYDYYPNSIIFPDCYDEFTEKLERLKERGHPDKDKLWIFKPSFGSQGEGIFIFNANDWKTTPLAAFRDSIFKSDPLKFEIPNKRLKNVPKEITKAVISEYIDKPLLYNGRKANLRILAVVTSFIPLRIYVHKESCMRLSTEQYGSDYTNSEAHICNFTDMIEEEYDSNDEEDRRPTTSSFSAFFGDLKDQGVDTDLLWSQIYDIIIKTILTMEDETSGFLKENPKLNQNLYELFGFDILIDDQLKPWFLEVNLSPNPKISSNLNGKIKTKLYSDLYSLVGFKKLETGTPVSEINKLALLDPKTGLYAHKDSGSSEEISSEPNQTVLRFHDLTLTDDQKQQVLTNITDDPTLTEQDKAFMSRLFNNPSKAQILESLAEFQRQRDFIRIFPSKGTDYYLDRFFTHDLQANRDLYSFLYEDPHPEVPPVNSSVQVVYKYKVEQQEIRVLGVHSKSDFEAKELFEHKLRSAEWHKTALKIFPNI
ncbi:unnamed protein product [Moneuplotes crassus]|uniref:Tubulin--tyrosine ligase-like protein 5 n=1 Tax=Euplotes crassus TaxID=5936 RepID=A0AAD2CVU1_EUPCR|nr:unnamed protein product [Moneuplotes crassus]